MNAFLELPSAGAIAIVVAVLMEAVLYFSVARHTWPRATLLATALLPYAIYTIANGLMETWSALALAGLAIVPLLWFRVLPRKRWTDAGFVIVMAVPIVLKVFGDLYPRPHPDIRLEFLGQLMWIRLGVTVVLEDRRPDGIGFGFWPKASEWRVGLLWAVFCVPLIMAGAILSGFASFQLPAFAWWQSLGIAAGTFFGILWVVALSEEFFFRGLLQRWVAEWTGSFAVGLITASILFGAVHLGFRQFPNWQFAALAGVAGLFYGMAYSRGGSIRAAMVTHAVVVTIWRTLFR